MYVCVRACVCVCVCVCVCDGMSDNTASFPAQFGPGEISTSPIGLRDLTNPLLEARIFFMLAP